MDRDTTRGLVKDILGRAGRSTEVDDATVLRTVGFRSLDFSELALRVEDRTGREVLFQADALRGIRTVGDVLDFFEQHA